MKRAEYSICYISKNAVAPIANLYIAVELEGGGPVGGMGITGGAGLTGVEEWAFEGWFPDRGLGIQSNISNREPVRESY